jgi:UDP-N-acetylglucosamine diphosphorylase/glucosamine-1-phosphate N-acetyltransferase
VNFQTSSYSLYFWVNLKKMPNLILFDLPNTHTQLLPLTFTRPIAEIRCGILTLREKWEQYFGKASWLTEDYLQDAFPCHYGQENLYVNGSMLATDELAEIVGHLDFDQAIVKQGTLLAVKTGWLKKEDLSHHSFRKYIEAKNIQLIERPWHIFQYNGAQIKEDMPRIEAIRHNYGVQDAHTILYGKERIFVDENVKIKASVLNAENGPIYLGPHSEVQEGSVIRGPFALCEGSTINMGGKMKGDTTIGPYSKVGGEVSNSVVFGYSNKGHDGFMGNSVIGEWCNLGADTNTSNLKNNYSNVSIWSYAENGMVDTGLQFCGLIMGDHSKAGINTMFNTGTVVGASANVFDGDFPPKHVPSFAWGKNEKYDFDKSIETAQRVMERRGKKLSPSEIKILKTLYP